ncbi:MAG: hypothetical protein E7317_00275 [Clostridiales bacterium]|nr:hypothetical protein [Clostridiales bacterium]
MNGKRIISVLLAVALVLTLGCAIASAEESGHKFEPLLLNAMDNSAYAWTSSSYQRALFSCLALADLVVDGFFDSLDPSLLINASFVGKDKETGLFVSLVAYNDKGVLSMHYSPDIGTAIVSFNEADFMTDSLMNMMVQSLDQYDYVKNSQSDVSEAAGALAELMKAAAN